MKEIKAKRGTVEHKVANMTLTLVGVNGDTDTYSDLGINGTMERYQERLGIAVARAEASKWINVPTIW